MAITHPKVEWFYNVAMLRSYGLLNLSGKWAVVKASDNYPDEKYNLVTDWLDSREAAIGFLKLLKEN